MRSDKQSGGARAQPAAAVARTVFLSFCWMAKLIVLNDRVSVPRGPLTVMVRLPHATVTARH